jgi:hypothetical protein
VCFGCVVFAERLHVYGFWVRFSLYTACLKKDLNGPSYGSNEDDKACVSVMLHHYTFHPGPAETRRKVNTNLAAVTDSSSKEKNARLARHHLP